jgi:hypothetical protein
VRVGGQAECHLAGVHQRLLRSQRVELRAPHVAVAALDRRRAVVGRAGEWPTRWMFHEPQAADVDPVGLTWWMHRRVDAARLPDRRVVIEFRYTGDGAMTIWMALDRGEPSVCMKHPGFDTDVLVSTDPVALMRVFSGIDSLEHARRSGSIEITGPSTLTRAFGKWFLWSPFAPAVRERMRQG